jgi:hypothetical protein
MPPAEPKNCGGSISLSWGIVKMIGGGKRQRFPRYISDIETVASAN